MTVNAQVFPDCPVRIVVPFGPGGLADITFRLVADRLTPLLGKQVLEDLRRQLAADIDKWTAAIKEAGIPQQ